MYFYSAITATGIPTKISHVWYYENRKVGVVTLDIQYPVTYTWSSMCILPEQIGDWQVSIVDQEGNVLKEEGFKVIPQTASTGKETTLPALKEKMAGEKYAYYVKPGLFTLTGGGAATNSYTYQDVNGRGSGSYDWKKSGIGTGWL